MRFGYLHFANEREPYISIGFYITFYANEVKQNEQDELNCCKLAIEKEKGNFAQFIFYFLL